MRTAAAGYEFGLAEAGDDEALRALLRRNEMGGSIRVTFEREPGFEDGAPLQGPFRQTVIGRKGPALVGLGTRAVGQAYLNGAPAPVGYLGDLKLDAAHRGGTLIARGYRMFRRLHEDGRCRLYTTVIVSDNEKALSTIASGRAGLPAYRDCGRLLSPLFSGGGRAPRAPEGVTLSPGRPGLLDDIVACLNRFNARRQFAPVHRAEDFQPGGRWVGARAEDFIVALREGRVIGTLALWDQRRFKQTRIAGYSAPLSWLRPACNAAAALLGLPQLPAPGALLPHAYAAFPSVECDDAGLFAALLQSVRARAAKAGVPCLIAGLHERDPLAPAFRGLRRVDFSGRLFCVSWEDGQGDWSALDQRPPYLEAAAL